MITEVASNHKSGIRPLNPAMDLGQLADLIENAFGRELTYGGQRVLREIRFLSQLGPLNYLFTGMSSEIDGIFNGFVWEQDGRVVGNVTVNRPTGHPRRWQISNVAVLDVFRGQGIGRRLVESAIHLIERRGGQSAYLFVRDDNRPALRLYEKLGFVHIDRSTELRFEPRFGSADTHTLRVLQPLQPQDSDALYELVWRAVGPGHRWLYTIRRSKYVLSRDERFFRWLESLFSAKFESRWQVTAGQEIHAALILHATRWWNQKPHRLELWVQPSQRGQVERALARDVVTLLGQQPCRYAYSSLPACEEQAIDALIACGFQKVRTLIMMKLDL